MTTVTIHGLIKGDTYRYKVGDTYSDLVEVPTSGDIDIVVPPENEVTMLLRASRLGFTSQVVSLFTDIPTFDYTPIFSIIPGVVYSGSTGLNVNDYIGHGADGIIIKQQMYNPSDPSTENVKENIGLWCEYSHTIPIFLLDNELPLIGKYEDDILNLNYPGDVIDVQKEISGNSTGHRPVQYTSDVVLDAGRIPIEFVSTGIVANMYITQAMIDNPNTSPTHIINYIRNITNELAPQTDGITIVQENPNGTFTVFGNMTRRQNVDFVAIFEASQERWHVTFRTINGTPLFPNIDHQNGKYFLGGIVSDAPSDRFTSAFPIELNSGVSFGKGFITCTTTRNLENDTLLHFRMNAERHNVIAENTGLQVLNGVADKSTNNSIDHIVILNPPQGDGTYELDQIIDMSISPVTFGPDAGDGIRAVTNLGQRGDGINFTDLLVGFDTPATFKDTYLVKEPIRVFVPLVYNDVRLSEYLLFGGGIFDPSTNSTLFDKLERLIIKNGDAINDLVDDPGAEVTDGTLDITTDLLTDIQGGYSGARFTAKEKILFTEVSAKFYNAGNVNDRDVKLVIRKLDGNTLGDELHNQDCEEVSIPTGSFTCVFKIDKELILEAGDYAIAFTTEDNIQLISDETDKGLGNLIYWNEGANVITTINSRYALYIAKYNTVNVIKLTDITNSIYDLVYDPSIDTYDTLTNANFVIDAPITTTIHEGFKISSDNKTILREVDFSLRVNRSGAEPFITVIFTLQKLVGTTLTGPIIHTQEYTFPYNIGSNHHNLKIVIDKEFILEPGDYAIGFLKVNDDHSIYVEAESEGKGNKLLRWDGNSNTVIESPRYTDAVRIFSNKYVSLKTINDPVQFRDRLSKNKYTRKLNGDGTKTVKLYDNIGNSVDTEWNVTTSNDTESRDIVDV